MLLQVDVNPNSCTVYQSPDMWRLYYYIRSVESGDFPIVVLALATVGCVGVLSRPSVFAHARPRDRALLPQLVGTPAERQVTPMFVYICDGIGRLASPPKNAAGDRVRNSAVRDSHRYRSILVGVSTSSSTCDH
jgi:hypothetical protein